MFKLKGNWSAGSSFPYGLPEWHSHALSLGAEPQDLSRAGCVIDEDVCVCAISPITGISRCWRAAEELRHTLLQALMVTDLCVCFLTIPISGSASFSVGSLSPHLLIHLSSAPSLRSVIHSSPHPEPFCSPRLSQINAHNLLSIFLNDCSVLKLLVLHLLHLLLNPHFLFCLWVGQAKQGSHWELRRTGWLLAHPARYTALWVVIRCYDPLLLLTCPLHKKILGKFQFLFIKSQLSSISL